MSGDVADDQGDPGAGERDDIEPVASYVALRAGRSVACGDLDGVEFGQLAGEQSALQGQGGGALTGVAAGVVDAHGGPGGQFRREGEVLVVERVRLLPPVEAGHAHQDVPGGQRNHHQGVRAGGPESHHPPGIVPQPVGGEVESGDEAGFEVGHATGLRRGRGEPAQLADRVRRPGVPAPGGPKRRTAERDAVFDRTRLGRLALHDGVQQIDGDGVGQPGDGHLGQFLRGPHDVQGGADVQTGLVEQSSPFLGPVTGGDVDDRVAQPEDGSGRVLEPEGTGGPHMLVFRVGDGAPAVHKVHGRYAGVQDLLHLRLDGLGAQARQCLPDPFAQPFRRRYAGHAFQGHIAPYAAQFGIGDQQADGRLGEESLHDRLVAFPAAHLGSLDGQDHPVRRGPGAFGAGRGVRPQDQLQQSAVPAAHGHVRGPYLRRPSQCAPCCGDHGRLGPCEQFEGGPAQDLGRRTAQQPFGSRAPPDNDTSGIQHGGGRHLGADDRITPLAASGVPCHPRRPTTFDHGRSPRRQRIPDPMEALRTGCARSARPGHALLRPDGARCTGRAPNDQWWSWPPQRSSWLTGRGAGGSPVTGDTRRPSERTAAGPHPAERPTCRRGPRSR